MHVVFLWLFENASCLHVSPAYLRSETFNELNGYIKTLYYSYENYNCLMYRCLTLGSKTWLQDFDLKNG